MFDFRGSGNEGHGGPPQGGVRASTSGALQRIKRPAMNHIRFIGLKNFPDRLLVQKFAADRNRQKGRVKWGVPKTVVPFDGARRGPWACKGGGRASKRSVV